MSTRLATTLGRRTLPRTVAKRVDFGRYRAGGQVSHRHDRLAAMASRIFRLDAQLDLRLTLGPNLRGTADPTMRLDAGRVVRATRTACGPATIEMVVAGDELRAEAWGPGAEAALAGAGALAGLDDDRSPFVPGRGLIGELDRRMAGLRIGRTGAVLEALVPAILEQKVTGIEARRGFRGLIARWGEPAPGPFGLRLLPRPEVLAAIPYHELHPLGIERRRADLIRTVGARAARFEEVVRLPREDAYRRLRALPGIGPWTAAEVALRALGDADAVSVGDFHLPNLVAFALAGEPRASDERMLELLEPYRGQRGRVIRLLELSGIRPPARGPRCPIRSIAAI
jgi:3-methyladenine DNA glycosylase/8-oxoguanine DNA glycosylase